MCLWDLDQRKISKLSNSPNDLQLPQPYKTICSYGPDKPSEAERVSEGWNLGGI